MTEESPKIVPDAAFEMTNLERLNLQKMIRENDVEDNTEYIRKIKHSDLISKDILKIQEIKQKYPSLQTNSPGVFRDRCMEDCPFLFKNYIDIFNRLCKDTLNIKLMSQFLYVLKHIEENKCDVHEGSVAIGRILKDLYVDSALQNANMLSSVNENNKNDCEESPPQKTVTPTYNITWKEYKEKMYT